jgi:hypothetical protein
LSVNRDEHPLAGAVRCCDPVLAGFPLLGCQGNGIYLLLSTHLVFGVRIDLVTSALYVVAYQVVKHANMSNVVSAVCGV